ncbi:MAG TPA: DUF4855 domain-containing protein [Syntrophomonadaceae bacterium]|nr:DUF4855 domain-containing protein [Syntrophomonadaceae bacterium]
MKRYVRDPHSDIAPSEGRTVLGRWMVNSGDGELTWEGSSWSLGAELLESAARGERTIQLQGIIRPQGRSTPSAGWIELETIAGRNPSIEDLFLVGTRPLPQENITCMCRHPIYKEYLVAGTMDSYLLLLDARLNANLAILAQTRLTAPVVSLVCCGKRLLGLEKYPGNTVLVIDTTTTGKLLPTFLPIGRFSLPLSLTVLAENDSFSAWGLTGEGAVYHLEVPSLQRLSQPHPLVLEESLKKMCSLGHRKIAMANISGKLKSTYRAIKDKQLSWQSFCFREGPFLGFAFDGKHYWSFQQSFHKETGEILLLYNQEGSLIRSFGARPEVSLSSLSYTHNHLLILDLQHQQLHQYHLADTMEPVTGLTPLASHHPGYLPGGTPTTGGIHDLCLLYVGGEGKASVHRYDITKLRPLVGYLTPGGDVKDFFMDGFLLLAQYSPLLNGRSFGTDLDGEPSRKEDWMALFHEYFHPQANLWALENCAKEINRCLNVSRMGPIKVVLSIPTADRRCTDWDHSGFSLAVDSHRVEVTHWAMQELIKRWKRTKFRHLVLAGFYYMTEQGFWDDLVLHTFPKLCQNYGLCSFAIPGITSSWITEFNRAGFDCVALQSSHAFWQPPDRPPHYLLKCAGRIAREFGMGMEVELPYDVLEPAGLQKARDYLEMAAIQGWAGAFKAYFQSYNLIKTLAESEIPACRQLYDELYRMSRLARRQKGSPAHLSRNTVAIDCRGKWAGDSDLEFFRLNIEGHQGVFTLTGLSVE